MQGMGEESITLYDLVSIFVVSRVDELDAMGSYSLGPNSKYWTPEILPRTYWLEPNPKILDRKPYTLAPKPDATRSYRPGLNPKLQTLNSFPQTRCNEILLAGGVSRSRFWMQMHADVTGLPVVVCECSEGPLLGCATLGGAPNSSLSTLKPTAHNSGRCSLEHQSRKPLESEP